MNEIDLSGRKFGRLKVIERSVEYWISKSGKTKSVNWICECECGTIKTVRACKLRDGTTKSCGCTRNETISLPRTTKGHSGLLSVYNGYKQGAKGRNLEFAITLEEFAEITSQNCHYCNAEPKNISTPAGRKKLTTDHGVYVYTGIDRMDNKKGYIYTNTIPCCRNCNVAKATLSYHEFTELAKAIYLNIQLRNRTSYKAIDLREYKNTEEEFENERFPNAVSQQMGCAAILKQII